MPHYTPPLFPYPLPIPLRIIFFRDGVSDGEFERVLATEVPLVRKACKDLDENYCPPITFVIVQKRHNTRLFMDGAGGGRPGANVPPVRFAVLCSAVLCGVLRCCGGAALRVCAP